MYANCNIINPKNRHFFTFIMLHPMQCDSNYFNDFLEYFENINKAKYLYDSIKFIFPESPIMDIDYPYKLFLYNKYHLLNVVIYSKY